MRWLWLLAILVATPRIGWTRDQLWRGRIGGCAANVSIQMRPTRFTEGGCTGNPSSMLGPCVFDSECPPPTRCHGTPNGFAGGGFFRCRGGPPRGLRTHGDFRIAIEHGSLRVGGTIGDYCAPLQQCPGFYAPFSGRISGAERLDIGTTITAEYQRGRRAGKIRLRRVR